MSRKSHIAARKRLEKLVLAVHRRNGGRLRTLNLRFRLLDPRLKLDSLDLAEILAAVELELGISPFDGPSIPHTWGDVLRLASGN